MSLTDGLFSDPELARIMGDPARLAAMGRVEAALARIQGQAGVIPADAAAAVQAVVATFQPDPDVLAPAVARAGIAAQAYVTALKSACGDAGGWAHFGATSQDVQDTALVLQLREALEVLAARLIRLVDTLAIKAQDNAETPIPARTRFQIAAPTTLGAKIAVWQAPLQRHLQRLGEMRPRLLALSFYGAAGTGAALGDQMGPLRKALGAALDLPAPDMPWHNARDGMGELGGWLSLVTGSLGKIGLDLILLAQSEVAEISAGQGGGSSTMPQKSNPVAAEALVTLARLNASDLGGLHQALIHAQERDGSAMGIEWALLPGMVIRTGAALRLALELAETLAPRPDGIAATFARDRGLMLAEAAGFALSRDMPRKQALALVGQALRDVAANPDLTLAQALMQLAPGRDWLEELDPARALGEAPAQARAAIKPTEETP
ncbi:MAG: lyase family protein [Paracoccus sp. (in: a-proteobacteria)]|uniref:lyase family protein n=1 Tax=Paracoccus sp. TaxID=267 RepID=UPI0026DFECC0|nr:lyase family protein [Paracoccus sp. (in: a-proteobacteria)]MDO5620319.1 lyase family protein [Paracoccus sp. (in: a-proteobacteria)]